MIGCVASKRTRSSSSIKIVRFGTSPFSSQCVLTNMGAWFPTSDKSKLGLRMSQLPNLKRYPSHCSCVTLEHFTKFCIMNTGSPASQRKLDHVETPQPNFVFTFLTSPNVVREYPRRSATKIYKNGLSTNPMTPKPRTSPDDSAVSEHRDAGPTESSRSQF